MKNEKSQPWIASAPADLVFILSPAFLTTALIISFPGLFGSMNQMPAWVWVVLIVCVDVAHVYSTLFRTYFDREEFSRRRELYLLAPLFGWIIGVVLYSINGLFFWRILAYLAVFHFVRQQYGFMMIYSRHETRTSIERWIDKSAIYLATFYPLVYWHTHLPRNFSWFVEGDFLAIHWPSLDPVFRALYFASILIYVGKEIRNSISLRKVNWPKNLLIMGTILSWYIGIVRFNGDLAFTFSNVVSHGIPYMALIWIYRSKKISVKTENPKIGKSIIQVSGFVLVILAFAYFEEGLWDGFIWRDHQEVFRWFAFLPNLTDKSTLAWIIPLLALPQTTHYILDGFIWRVHGKHTEWKSAVLKTFPTHL